MLKRVLVNMQNIVSVLGLVVGFVLLVRGADAFVDRAGTLATRAGIPPLVVGLTVVALGTSAPETAISIVSATQGTSDVTIANVLGSNIVNTLVILGLVALVARIPMRRSTLVFELPFVLCITAMLLVLSLHDGVFGRLDALMFLALLAGYLVHVIKTARSEDEQTPAEQPKEDERSSRRLMLGALGGAVAICAGAQFVVQGATNIAGLLGLSDRVIGLTVVALGTSLPELVTSLTAARRGETDIALGNVIGSSVFSILFALGVSGVIAPMPFGKELLLDGAVALAAVALLWLVSIRRKALGRTGGAVLLSGYAAYLTHLLAA